MAKELPYFQFEPAEYLTKDVSFCSLAAQGFFINLCSYYWQRGCDLTEKQLLKRLNHVDLLNELVSENVVKVVDNQIKVSFLDAQYEKATSISNTNRMNGLKGGRPKKENPIKTETKPKQNPIESESKGIREDKIIKDNIKEYSNAKAFASESDFLEFFNQGRKVLLGTEGKTRVMSSTDSNNFKKLNKAYTRLEFKHAIKMMSKEPWVKTASKFTISHLLAPANFDKYLNKTETLPMAQGLIEGN